MPRRLHKSPTSIEKKVETGLQISTSEGVPTTEAGLTCYIHYYAGGYPPELEVRKTRFLVCNPRVSSVEKKVRKCQKRFVDVFLFSNEFRKKFIIKIYYL